MSKASNFFYSTNTETTTLYRKLLPSEDKRTLQSERWNTLAKFLLVWFKKRGIIVTHWQQGSCKFGTQIRPLHQERSDVDLGIYAELGKVAPPSSVVKAMVQEALLEYSTITTEVINVEFPSKERACRVIFDEYFHIDVPIYHYDPNTKTTLLATETKGWEASDPSKMVDWFLSEVGTDEERCQLRRIIRYFKGWASLKFNEAVRPSSTLLTVLVTNAFKSIKSEMFDDEMFLEISRQIVASLNKSQVVNNPVNQNEDLNRMGNEGTKRFIEQLNNSVKIGESTLSLKTSFEICNRWAEIFEHLFPLCDLAIEGQNNANLPALIQPEIDIVATSKEYKNRSFTGRNSVGPIPKNCQINFKIVSNLPPNTEVHWTVRNKGDEAEDHHDLGHSAGHSMSISRNSAYNGSHFMDCTLKDLHGYVLGFRRVTVFILDKINRKTRSTPGYRRIVGMKR